jgi:hypothetical protein
MAHRFPPTGAPDMTRLLTGLCMFALLVARTAAQERPLVLDYYPLKVGSQWTYQAGSSKEPVVIRVEKEVTLDLPPNEKTDVVEKAAGFQLKITSGDLNGTEDVAVLRDGVYKFSQNGKAIKPPLRFFKVPLEAGKSWTAEWKGDDGKVNRREFTAGAETLELTINGKKEKLPTVVISSRDAGQDSSIKYWFAKGFGMVKEQVTIGKKESTLELKEFK